MTSDRVAIFALATLLFGNFFFVQADPDLWGHLRFGLTHLESGNLATVDPYAYTTAGQYWTNHEWLTELAFGWCFRSLGVFGLVALRAVLLSITTGAVIVLMRRRGVGGAALLGIGCLLVAILAGLFRVRPQMFTYTCMALLLLTCDTYERGKTKWIWCVPLLLVGWTNFHAGFVAGLGVFGVYWLSFLVNAWRSRDVGELLSLLSIGALCGLATLMNPYGIHYWDYVVFAVGLDRPNIAEWQPILAHNITVQGYYLVLVLGPLLLWWRNRWQASPVEVVLFGLGALMAAKHGRHLAFLAMFSAVFAASQLSLPQHFQRRLVTDKRVVWGRLAFLLLLLPTLGAGLSNAATGLFTAGHQSLYVSTERYPIQAVDFIDRNHLRGNLDCGFTWGEYVLFQLFPRCRVFCDGRYETVYPQRVAELALDTAHDPTTWSERITNYPTDMIIAPTRSGFAEWLTAGNEFVQIYADETAVVFIRNSPEHQSIIERAQQQRLLPPRRASGLHQFPA